LDTIVYILLFCILPSNYLLLTNREDFYYNASV
jgi:hypothetical protein